MKSKVAFQLAQLGRHQLCCFVALPLLGVCHTLCKAKLPHLCQSESGGNPGQGPHVYCISQLLGVRAVSAAEKSAA